MRGSKNQPEHVEVESVVQTAESVPVTLARIDEKLTGVLTRDNDHEKRIRSLEKTIWLGVGFAAAVGSASGSLFARLVN